MKFQKHLWDEIVFLPKLFFEKKKCKFKSGGVNTVKPVLSGHSKRRPNIGFQTQLWLNAGQKVLQNAPTGAFCNTFVLHELPFVIKIFVLSIFEWPLKAGFTVLKL